MVVVVVVVVAELAGLSRSIFIQYGAQRPVTTGAPVCCEIFFPHQKKPALYRLGNHDTVVSLPEIQ